MAETTHVRVWSSVVGVQRPDIDGGRISGDAQIAVVYEGLLLRVPATAFPIIGLVGVALLLLLLLVPYFRRAVFSTE